MRRWKKNKWVARPSRWLGAIVVLLLVTGGFVKANVPYYFVRDYQGNVRQVVNGSTGTVVQENHYYPYGTLFGESSATALSSSNGVSASPYKFGGKEQVNLSDNTYLDFAARMYDYQLGRFQTPDPLCWETPGVSSYSYCAADPVNFVDPTGMLLKAEKDIQEVILLSLSESEANQVRFDDNGFLDTAYLREGGELTDFLKILLQLGESDIQYNVKYSEKTSNGELMSNKNGGLVGYTETPSDKYYPSPTPDVNVLIFPKRPRELIVGTLAHELFGHAYFYDIFRNAETISHNRHSNGVELVWGYESQKYVYAICERIIPKPLETIIEQNSSKAKDNYRKRMGYN